MKANPGGEIAPRNILGRDALIASLWESLAQQSVMLVSERRIGKSCVAKKMEAEPPDSILVIYDDVEGIASPGEFVERLCRQIHEHLSLRKRTMQRVRGFLKSAHNAEFAGVKLPDGAAADWAEILEHALADLAEMQEESTHIVFFWDELPVMVHKIQQAAGEAEAMKFLDVLRRIRQTNSKIRMVYTGSIGLHHVIAALRTAGHVNDSTNDMLTVEVEPLEIADAVDLAKQLLQGEEITSRDEAAVAAAIAESVDRVPYYIHHVIRELRHVSQPVTVQGVGAVVDTCLVDPQDRWHLKHYQERLPSYYPGNALPVLRAILDELASAGEPLAFTELHQRLGAHLTPGDGAMAARILEGNKELLREALTMLERDHYISRRPGDGAFAFRYPLIARWWRTERGLPT